MDKRIEKIIANYFDGKVSEEEAKEIVAWIEKGNKAVFDEYVALNFSLELLKLEDSNKHVSSWERIASEINSKNSAKVIPLYKRALFKYAAAILIFLSAGYFFFLNREKPADTSPIAVDNTIKIGTDKATLTLEDGTDIILEKGKEYVAEDLSSNGEALIYNIKPEEKPEIAYNYLTIPRGGEYFVKLSDGTKVWLNSESKLKYPVSFVEGETREVELIYGEAYFDVSPSTDHNGAKFKVKHNMQEIEVLGTEFNIKAYQDEAYIYTTLVEGSVAVNNGVNKQKISPNEQVVFDVNTNTMQVGSVNVLHEVSWVKGNFIFKRKSLKDIMKVLSRWYDADIVFVDKSLQDIEFTGSLSKSQNIEKILLLIKNTKIINSYDINKNTITLK